MPEEKKESNGVRYACTLVMFENGVVQPSMNSIFLTDEKVKKLINDKVLDPGEVFRPNPQASDFTKIYQMCATFMRDHEAACTANVIQQRAMETIKNQETGIIKQRIEMEQTGQICTEQITGVLCGSKHHPLCRNSASLIKAH